jgi:Uma2 family endonuclease
MSSVTTSDGTRSFYRAAGASSAPPPLENGDRLTLREFIRRYEAMPHVKKAELIGGTVFMGAAVRLNYHGRPHGWLGNIVTTYAMRTGLDFADNATVELDPDNAPQPDLFIYLPSEAGGRAHENEHGYLEGPPDFIAEIAASSASLDLNGKLRSYENAGVREYVVWRVLDDAFNWFEWQAGKYIAVAADQSGIFRSRVLPGLWVDAPALLARDAQRLWATLDAGMATQEYRDFAAKMKGVLKK